MKNSKKEKSLITIYIQSFLVYTALILLVYWIVAAISDRTLASGIPTMQGFLSFQTGLMQDQFKKLDNSAYKNCRCLVFDETGQVLYRSDTEIGENLGYADLEFILPDGSQDSFSFMQDHDGAHYWVFEYLKDPETGNTIMEKYSILDQDYAVEGGSLFSSDRQLTEKEVLLLQGRYDDSHTLTRYDYQNARGKQRVLLFVAPDVSDEDYQNVVKKSSMIWLIAAALILVSLGCLSMLMVRIVRNGIRPLHKAIQEYEAGGDFRNDLFNVPREFSAVADSFAHLTEQLKEKERQRQAEAESKNRIIMDLSHDLKTPLTVIRGYAIALEEKRVSGSDADHYLEILRHKADVSVEMINDLVHYSSMAHPDYELLFEEKDLVEVCRSVLAEKYEDLDEQGMELDVDLPEEEIRMQVNVRVMESLLNNLVSNSCKYNEAGTRLYFSIRRDRDRVYMRFADNGVGISPEMRQKIFEPFTTENTARTSEKGTGIGMAIVSQAVRLHKGTIRLTDPAGTEFSTIFDIELKIK